MTATLEGGSGGPPDIGVRPQVLRKQSSDTPEHLAMTLRCAHLIVSHMLRGTRDEKWGGENVWVMGCPNEIFPPQNKYALEAMGFDSPPRLPGACCIVE